MIQFRKIVFGLSVASGALLTAWLLTGERKHQTREYIVRKSNTLKKSLQSKPDVFDDSEAHYV